MSPTLSKLLCLAVLLYCGATVCEGVISVPLTGYQQGIKLQIVPPAIAGQQCYVYGVPTPFGLAPEGPTPLSVYTYKNTGSHVIEFEYKRTDYSLAPLIVPGDTIIQVDTSDSSRPLVKFDSNQSPQGKYAYVSVQLLDMTGRSVCVSDIALVMEAPLSCLPTWGGVYDVINPVGPTVVLPSTGGRVVVPSGSVYAPTYVQNTVIQQFLTVNNVNINNINIVNNVVAITNVTIIKNVAAPPSPTPVNCTTNPSVRVCQQNIPFLGPIANVTVVPTIRPSIPAAGPVRPIVVVDPPVRSTSFPPTTNPTTQTTNPTTQTVQPPSRQPTNQGTTQTVLPPVATVQPTTQTAQPFARAPTAIATGRRLRA